MVSDAIDRRDLINKEESRTKSDPSTPWPSSIQESIMYGMKNIEGDYYKNPLHNAPVDGYYVKDRTEFNMLYTEE